MKKLFAMLVVLTPLMVCAGPDDLFSSRDEIKNILALRHVPNYQAQMAHGDTTPAALYDHFIGSVPLDLRAIVDNFPAVNSLITWRTLTTELARGGVIDFGSIKTAVGAAAAYNDLGAQLDVVWSERLENWTFTGFLNGALDLQGENALVANEVIDRVGLDRAAQPLAPEKREFILQGIVNKNKDDATVSALRGLWTRTVLDPLNALISNPLADVKKLFDIARVVTSEAHQHGTRRHWLRKVPAFTVQQDHEGASQTSVGDLLTTLKDELKILQRSLEGEKTTAVRQLVQKYMGDDRRSRRSAVARVEELIKALGADKFPDITVTVARLDVRPEAQRILTAANKFWTARRKYRDALTTLNAVQTQYQDVDLSVLGIPDLKIDEAEDLRTFMKNVNEYLEQVGK